MPSPRQMPRHRMDPRSAKKNTYSFEDERSSHPVCGATLPDGWAGQIFAAASLRWSSPSSRVARTSQTRKAAAARQARRWRPKDSVKRSEPWKPTLIVQDRRQDSPKGSATRCGADLLGAALATGALRNQQDAKRSASNLRGTTAQQGTPSFVGIHVGKEGKAQGHPATQLLSGRLPRTDASLAQACRCQSSQLSSQGATPTPEVPPPPPLGWRGETTAPPRLSRELTLQARPLTCTLNPFDVDFIISVLELSPLR